MNIMKVVVTGGAGFIGSHTVDILIKNGYEVVVIDNLSRGKKDNINSNAKFIRMDIKSNGLRKVFKQEKPDFVMHLAAQIDLAKSIEDPLFDAKENILGTINLLECCKWVKKIVYSSSIAVYGIPKYLPVDEKHPTELFSPYGLSKFVSEEYIRLYNKLYGLSYTILRYSNVYGPRQSPEGEAGVVSIFTKKLLRKESPIIFGDGRQTRDFVYVEDVANANLLALQSDKNGIYNIGSGKETEINELFRRIKDIIRVNVNPNYEKPRKEIKRICVNYENASKYLKWKPKTSLKEGLKKTIEWFSRK